MVVITCMVVGNIGFDGFGDVVTKYNGYFDPTNATNPSGNAAGIGWLEIFKMTLVVSSASLLWPPLASRTLSVQSPAVAKKLFLFSTIPLSARHSIPVIWGIGAFAFFATHGELGAELQTALASKAINPWSAMPLYLAKIIPSGLLGLVTAGMVAAFMSTHDSYLLCWSGVIAQDIVGPVFGPLSQRTRILITRISILTIGGFLLTWGLWYELSSNLWNYMAVTGTVYLSGAVPVVVGGLYWRRASSAGAYFALLGGLCGLLAMDPSIEFLKSNGINMEGAHLTILTFLISFSGFVIVSLLFPDKNDASARTNEVSP